MYYPDLSPFRYHSFDPWPNVLNVGWLDQDMKYAVGEVPGNFLEKLLIYCQHPVFLSMGYHECNICGMPSESIRFPDGGYAVLGSAEIRVFGKNGVVYASPDMIYHYVILHKYTPPDEFIISVLESDFPHQLKMLRKIYDNFM